MLYSGRRPSIKDGIGFQQGGNVKLNAPKKLSNFVKGKAPMVQDNEGYILYPASYREKATVKVRIAVKRKDPRILPDMAAKVTFLEQDPAKESAAAD